MILSKRRLALLLSFFLVLALPVHMAHSRIADPGAFKGYDGILHPAYIFLNLSRGELFLRSKLAVNLGLIRLSAKQQASDGPVADEAKEPSVNYKSDSGSDNDQSDDDEDYDALGAYKNQMAIAASLYAKKQTGQILESGISAVLQALFRPVAGLLEFRPRGSKQTVVPFMDENFIAALLGQYVSGKSVKVTDRERFLTAVDYSPVFVSRLNRHRQDKFCVKSNLKRQNLNDTPFNYASIKAICDQKADLKAMLAKMPLNELFRDSFTDNLTTILAPFGEGKIDLLYTRSLLALVAAKIAGRQGAQNYYVTLDKVLDGVLQTTNSYPTENDWTEWRQDHFSGAELSKNAEVANYKPIVKKLLSAIQESRASKNDKNGQIAIANLVPQVLAIEIAANQTLPLIEYSSATIADGKSFMDCDETSMRNAVMQLIYIIGSEAPAPKQNQLVFDEAKNNDNAKMAGTGDVFSSKRLLALGARKDVLQYFSNFNTLEALATEDARNQWAALLSGVDGLDYVKKKSRCELRSGALQVIKTFGKILFTNLKTPPANWQEFAKAVKTVIPDFVLIDAPASNIGQVEFKIGEDRQFVWSFTGGHDVITEKGGGAKIKNAKLKPGFINLLAAFQEIDFTPTLNDWHNRDTDLALVVLELSMISALTPDISDFTAMLTHFGFHIDPRYLFLVDYASDKIIYNYIAQALYEEFYDFEYLDSLIQMLPPMSDQFMQLRKIIDLSTPAGAVMSVLIGAYGGSIYLNGEGLYNGPVNLLVLEGLRLRASGPARYSIEAIDSTEAAKLSKAIAAIYKAKQNIKNSFGNVRGLLLADCDHDFESFSDFVAFLPGLTRIALGDECFSSEILLSHGLNKGLETLLVQDNLFNDNMASGFAGTLGNFPNLSVFYVVNSRITAKGAFALAQGVNKLQAGMKDKSAITLDMTKNAHLKTKELAEIAVKFGNAGVQISLRD